MLEQRGALTRETETNKEKKQRLITEISESKEKLKNERGFEKNFTEKFEYLNKRKQEMDGFEDIEQEMETLEHRINKINRDVAGNSNFLKIVSRVKQEIESLNKSLIQIIDDYQDSINNYRHILLLKHDL